MKQVCLTRRTRIFKMSDTAGKQPSIVTIFAIWNTMMGTSILSMPWALTQAGLTLGVLMMISMGFLALYSCYRILNSPSTIEGPAGCGLDYPDVCHHYFGRAGRVLCLAFSMTALGGAIIIYWVLMSNFLYNTGVFLHHKIHGLNVSTVEEFRNHSLPVLCRSLHSKPSMEVRDITNITTSTGPVAVLAVANSAWSFERLWNLRETVPLYLVVLIMPLLNFKSALFFTRFNILGTLSVLYLVVLVTVKASQWGGVHLRTTWFNSDDEYFIPEFNVNFPVMSGVLTLAYFIHNCVITLLKNNRHAHHNVRDLAVGYLLVGSTYLYVGSVVFICFPSLPPLSKRCIEQNFLDNLPSDDFMAVAARIFLLFQLTTVYPLLAYMVRVQLLTHFFGDPYPSLLHVLGLNVLLVLLGVLVARFYPNIGSIIRYSGALCGLVFVFVFPCLIHLISRRRLGSLSVPSAVFHLLVMALGVANLVAQFLV
ncbi:neutral amino acid transporter 9-like isoform X4 [Petromyzon marinus]|uniref:neutral amino acid transporter 9-like isoform X4 n=1 Tax=Petromyzon marinus TaxID=7757 RepID=UPI003F6E472B